jgi:hypothetical protein
VKIRRPAWQTEKSVQNKGEYTLDHTNGNIYLRSFLATSKHDSHSAPSIVYSMVVLGTLDGSLTVQ